MVATQPSVTGTTPPLVDEDSVLLSHSIYDILNNRSWAKDSNKSADTEDDELQKEIEMLSYAEREVSQEISDLVRMFSKQSEKQTKKTTLETSPQKLNSAISPMNKIYKKLTKREDKYEFQEKQDMTKDATTGLRNKKKMLDYVSKIQEENITKVTNDTRESPCRSQPSDEMNNGIFGVCIREPPEEILFFDDDDDESSVDDNPAIAYGDAHYVGEQMSESDEKLSESDETSSLTSQEGTELSTDEKKNGEGEKFERFSEWSVGSGELFDIEKGGHDLFEEESFWEESFWKTPVSESGLMQLGRPDKGEAKTRREIIDALSLPTLDHKRGSESNAQLDGQSIRSKLQVLRGESVDVHTKASTRRQSIVSKFLHMKSLQILPNIGDNQFITHTQKQEGSQSRKIYAPLQNEGNSMIAMKKERSRKVAMKEEKSHRRNDGCDWRVIVCTVHAILTIIGVAVCMFFLRRRGSEHQVSYGYQTPTNNDCSFAVNVWDPTKSEESFTPATMVQGTTLGATKEIDPCDPSVDHVGVWFSITGTGGRMIASSQTASGNDIYLSILQGKCNNLVCTKSDDDLSYKNEDSSLTWLSVAGESYHILVHGDASLAGNFSLSISEAPSRESRSCDASPFLLLPSNEADFSISGTMEVSTIHKKQKICSHISEVGSVAWYSILGNGKELTVSICDDDSDSPIDDEMSIELYSGHCNDLKCFPGGLDAGSLRTSILQQRDVRWQSVPQKRYYIFVRSSKKERTTFKLCGTQSELR